MLDILGDSGGRLCGGLSRRDFIRIGGEIVERRVHFGEAFATLHDPLGNDPNRVRLPDLAGRPHYLVDDWQPMPELVQSEIEGPREEEPFSPPFLLRRKARAGQAPRGAGKTEGENGGKARIVSSDEHEQHLQTQPASRRRRRRGPPLAGGHDARLRPVE